MNKEKTSKIQEVQNKILEDALLEAIEHKSDDSIGLLKSVLGDNKKELKSTVKSNNVINFDKEDIDSYESDEFDTDDFEDEDIKDEDYISDDFDVAHDLVPLPSKGLIYKGVKSKIPVSYLTASDEDYISSPNLYLDGKIIDLLLNKKILDKNINPLDLCKGDRDALIIWLRSSGYGSNFPVSVRDPESGNMFETEVDLLSLTYKDFNLTPDIDGYFDFILPKTKHNVKFRFLTYRDELSYTKLLEKTNPKFKKLALDTVINSIKEIFKSEKNITDKLKNEITKSIECLNEYSNTIDDSNKNTHLKSVTFFLERSIVSINGFTDRNYIKKYISMMPAFDSIALRKYVNDNTPGIDFSVSVNRPESLGGGSINTFLEFDYTIFLHII